MGFNLKNLIISWPLFCDIDMRQIDKRQIDKVADFRLFSWFSAVVMYLLMHFYMLLVSFSVDNIFI